MTKKLIAIILYSAMVMSLCGCNFSWYDWIDTNYHFNKAIISMPDGSVIEVEVAKWADAQDGEQLTITAKDGTRYLTSSYNCILVEEAHNGE